MATTQHLRQLFLLAVVEAVPQAESLGKLAARVAVARIIWRKETPVALVRLDKDMLAVLVQELTQAVAAVVGQAQSERMVLQTVETAGMVLPRL